MRSKINMKKSILYDFIMFNKFHPMLLVGGNSQEQATYLCLSSDTSESHPKMKQLPAIEVMFVACHSLLTDA